MRRRWSVLLVATAALALHGCGGGSSDTPTATATPGTPSTSTPTSPPPSTTPPSSAVYDLASDFTRDRSFNAIGLRVVTTTSPQFFTVTLDSRLDAENEAIGFTFAVADRTYHARYNDDKLDIATSAATYASVGYSYDQSTAISNSALIRSPSLLGMRYTGYVDWKDTLGMGQSDPANRLISHYLLFGARTLAAEIPASAAKTFTGSSSTYSGTTESLGRAATIAVDFATRTVTVTTEFRPTPIGSAGSSFSPGAPLTMSGTLDPATGRLSGTVTFDGGPAGIFEGALYGPLAAEAGLLFKVNRSDGTPIYGFIFARP